MKEITEVKESMNVPVKIKMLGGKIPEYKTDGSACADAYANESMTIQPGDIRTIRLGFAVEIPKGYEIQVRPRSGLAVKDYQIGVLGTIDSDYRGEVCAIIYNCTNTSYTVSIGERICQLKLSKVPIAEFIEVDELSSTRRGEGGFGSTGKK